MIANPILRREVLSSLRTGKAAAMQAAFFLMAAGVVWLYWPADGLADLGGRQARLIFSILAVGELLAVALCAPAFTAAAITAEKEHGTFESVFATALRPWEIALGKMAGALAFLLLMVVTGLVPLSVPLLMGGVGALDVARCMGVLLVTAVYLGTIGLLVSSIMHRSYRAIIVTYAAVGLVMFVLALPCWPISGHLIARGGAGAGAVLHVLASLSPLEAMLSVVWPQSPYAAGAPQMPPFWLLYLPLSAAVIVVAAVLCMVRLRRPPAPPRPREKLQVIERDGKITARSVLFLIDPRKRKRPIRAWQNPVLVKECRSRPMLQGQWLMRAFWTCLIVAVVLMLMVALSLAALVEEASGMIGSVLSAVSVMMVALVLLIGPAMAGGTICGDIETGVWDLMRSTPLSSWQIVSGKFQAAVVPMLLLMLSTLPGLMILLYFDVHLWPHVARVLAVVTMTVLLVATAGMLCSSLARRTSTATAWTYALVIASCLLAMVATLAQDRFSERVVWWAYAINPVSAVLGASGFAPVEKLGLVGWHLKIMGLATAAMVLATVARVVCLRRAS